MAEDQPIAEDVAGESLIQGRAKRSTAGRHMSALLDAEADDDLALLFEEIEDDNDFSVDAEEDGGEDDERLDSSSDDDDQGPNAQDDNEEGEDELKKEAVAERKKRRAHEDLRMKTFRKKVKIDPTAVPAESAPRPKKKSERISWIPTVEDGPTRSSSRRQTMQNKEVTHAKLKDSEEKRIRLIATMEAAAKRKARLKPKEMTQAERLAEAERVEKHNSKSLNRWEEMEKRKAEERKAKIEALQNRRLEGPVMSYWSGLATWTNGRLTRVGKVDITQKPEKEENTRRKSKKVEKEDKDKTVTEQKPATEPAAGDPVASQAVPTGTSENTTAPAVSGEGETTQKQGQPETAEAKIENPEPGNQPSTQENEKSSTEGENTKTVPDNSTTPAKEAPTLPAAAEPSTTAAGAAPDTKTSDSVPPPTVGTKNETMTTESKAADEAPKEEKEGEKGTAAAATETAAGDENSKAPSADAALDAPQTQEAPEAHKETPQPAPEQQKTELPTEQKEDAGPKQPEAEPSTTAQPGPDAVPDPKTTTPVAPTAAIPTTQQGEPPAPTPTPQEPATSEMQMDIDQPAGTNESAAQPEVPPPPPVIEQTGRNLTILENFDDKTAQSREFSIYFNAKKPPRLTKISSSLCVITSLPSRYRDPDTSLPFANAYAHREIQRTASQRSAWSPMLGCYVGPVGVAARGVPARFLGGDQAEENGKEGGEEAGSHTDSAEKEGDKEGVKKEGEKKAVPAAASTPTPATPAAGSAPSVAATPVAATPTPVAGGGGDPMEVDAA
ncbi:hypothetical protein ASPWEDRAFT_46282 [Aspergillus wentii DTO 134E9]|uniref:Vps72/YL1 C-terminal domain-containing protein n=1 Tax=Aspergillus wentii DTO 134E9 TaxID=1073089 RepID=A0A1L9R6W9_ASPWE|nr:uncharacterized protein ASPWEDRAFT_46282 [Aspergillus wentii DTO 134E9]KAI9926679.1 hypothetical protein MW887_003772 [Aspergillus wentii]OJJ30659.1 hypothetical protein ASPWEDRAFT_46282 [Aspergillus wentii DTO 134E9]